MSESTERLFYAMDLLTELEHMVINVVDESDAERELDWSDDVITRWKQLFCYTKLSIA
jgi:hypothetical protein